MVMTDLIAKKRDQKELSREEIEYMIREYTNGGIPDYQMSAMCMAILLNGMTREETLHLTTAMTNSGDVIDLSDLDGIKADKHSTGGVGDKTSLILCPLLASCGIKMAKMSGRGLGHTGGTLDKLESFHGYSTSISEEKFRDNVKEIGLAALAFGFLFTIIGFIQASEVIQLAGDIAPAVIWGGVKVGLLPIAYGLIVYIVSLVIRIIKKPRI